MSDEDSNEERNNISKKRRIFTIDEKLEVLDFIKSHSINKASRKFTIDRQNIREWQKQKQKLLSLRESKSGKRLRLDGAGRHLRDKEFDEQMIVWIRKQRACNQRVSRRTIQIHALQIANQADEEETIFKASRGWLEKFMLRHNLRVRIPTTVCQKPPIEYEKKLVDFILYIQRQRQSNIYHHIYAADETAVWLDASGGKGVAVKGAKETCGITNAFDGSEDGEIHCFKEDGPVPNGMCVCNRHAKWPSLTFWRRALQDFLRKLTWSKTKKMDLLVTDQWNYEFRSKL